MNPFGWCCKTRRRPRSPQLGPRSPRAGCQVHTSFPTAETSSYTSVLPRWRGIVRHLLRFRRLQRLFGYLGQHLQRYPSSLRLKLRQTWPAPGSGAPR
eukprot:14553317-Heterocapsa_arctica.AAC.1